jgi:hypothetical protein
MRNTEDHIANVGYLRITPLSRAHPHYRVCPVEVWQQLQISQQSALAPSINSTSYHELMRLLQIIFVAKV